MQRNYKTGLKNYLYLALFILVVGISLGYHQITPTRLPKNIKEDIITLEDIEGEDANFSMIMSHVYQMAKEPHESGSKEIEAVRNYLIQQFKTIDCDYQVQEFTVNMLDNINQQVDSYQTYIDKNPKEEEPMNEYLTGLGFTSYEDKYRSDINCIDTDILNGTNYIVKVDAPETDQGVMFVSHYDSTMNGPGAADDLISVASMLEVLREVKNKNKLTNDMYFLFTDAEELNLYGAAAYVEKNLQMKNRINLVINLEARGTSGTLLMFQTSNQNKQIIKELNNALDHISMFSFTAALYKIMPNDTDLTEFLNAGYVGINFAVLGNPENYHEMSDNYENIDRNSAYMYYRTTLDLATYFGTSNLELLNSSEDAVYYPFFKGNTVVVSYHVMFIISCFIGIASFVWMLLLLLRKETKLRECTTTLFLLLLPILGAAFTGILGAMLYNKMWQSAPWVDIAGTLNLIFFLLCFLVIMVTLLFVFRIAIKAKGKQTLLFSGMVIFNLLNWVCIFTFNSLAYIFTIPLCILLIYSIFLYNVKDSSIKNYISFGYLLLQGLIVLMLYTPIIYLMYTALLSSLLVANTMLVGIAVLPIAILCASALQIIRPEEYEK